MSAIGGHLEEFFAHAGAAPNTYSQDLDAAVSYIEDLASLFDAVRRDVYVSRAVVQLENSSGYHVGYAVFDAESDAFRFIPHIDSHEEARP